MSVDNINHNAKDTISEKSYNFKNNNNNNVKLMKSFYNECYLLMGRRLYKKVYNDIDNKFVLLKNDLISYKLQIIKLDSICKIITNRLDKTNSYNLSKELSTHRWFDRFEEEIKAYRNVFLTEFEDINNENIFDKNQNLNKEINEYNINNQTNYSKDSIYAIFKKKIKNQFNLYIESYIYFLTKRFYLLSLFEKKKENIAECLCYLSYSLKIVDMCTNFTTNCKSLILFQDVCILLVKLHLADNDILEAYNYIKKGLFLCYRSLFLIVDLKYGLESSMDEFIDNLMKHTNTVNDDENIINNKDKPYYLIKIFNSIVLLLFYQGICYEHMGFINYALFCYSQAKYFTGNYIVDSKENSEFYEFLSNIQNKLEGYKENFNILYRIKADNMLNNKLTPKNSSTIKKDSSIIFNNYFKIKNMKQKVNYIKSNIEEIIYNSIKPDDIREIELFNKSDTVSEFVAKMTYSNKLISYLLSKDFTHVLLKLKYPNTVYFEGKAFDLIQKEINRLKNEKYVKIAIDKNKNLKNDNALINLKENNNKHNLNLNINNNNNISNNNFKTYNLDINKINQELKDFVAIDNLSSIDTRDNNNNDLNSNKKLKNILNNNNNNNNNNLCLLDSNNNYKKLNLNKSNQCLKRSLSACKNTKIKFNSKTNSFYENNNKNVVIKNNKKLFKKINAKINCNKNKSKINSNVKLNKDYPFKFKYKKTLSLDKIKNYPHSNYLLAPSYRNKYKILDMSLLKDNKFHKEILKIKSSQIISFERKTEKQIYDEKEEYLNKFIKANKLNNYNNSVNADNNININNIENYNNNDYNLFGKVNSSMFLKVNNSFLLGNSINKKLKHLERKAVCSTNINQYALYVKELNENKSKNKNSSLFGNNISNKNAKNNINNNNNNSIETLSKMLIKFRKNSLIDFGKSKESSNRINNNILDNIINNEINEISKYEKKEIIRGNLLVKNSFKIRKSMSKKDNKFKNILSSLKNSKSLKFIENNN